MILNKEINLIEIVWKGPFRFDDLNDLEKCTELDCIGLYQIYGNHPVNGTNQLLYIGLAEQQYLRSRLIQHHNDWINYEDSERFVYVGTLHDPNEESRNIKIAEELLIYYCAPPYNSNMISDLKMLNTKAGEEVIILNLWKKNLLPFEVSTLWYNSKAWEPVK